MRTVHISLNSIDKVKSFVNDLAKFDVDFDLVSGRYIIDAKSIMGIFLSLIHISQSFQRGYMFPINLSLNTANASRTQECINKIGSDGAEIPTASLIPHF